MLWLWSVGSSGGVTHVTTTASSVNSDDHPYCDDKYATAYGDTTCPSDPTPFTKPPADAIDSGGTTSCSAALAISVSGPNVNTPIKPIHTRLA